MSGLLDRAPTPADLGSIHRAFVAAFSDYVVPMKLSEEGMTSLFAERGISWPHSRIVLSTHGVVAGFWMTGLERRNDGCHAYDIVTGVVPEHRRKGLGRRLHEGVVEGLAEEGVATLTLEVIATNHRAVALYEQLGFDVVRTLDCFRLAPSRQPPPVGVTLREAESARWTTWRTFRAWPPPWTNSDRTIERSAARFVEAERDGTTVAYAVLLPRTSQIGQVAVHPEHRRLGIGRAVLGALDEGTSLTWLNVPADDLATRGLVDASGGELLLSQYEMRHHL